MRPRRVKQESEVSSYKFGKVLLAVVWEWSFGASCNSWGKRGWWLG